MIKENKKENRPKEKDLKAFMKQKKLEENRLERERKEREREAHKAKLIKLFHMKEELKRKKHLEYKNKLKQTENSKQIQEFTKDVDFNMIDNSNNEKNSELEEKFIESQKLMDQILIDKNELQEIFVKLKEKLNHMNPNTIRNISEDV